VCCGAVCGGARGRGRPSGAQGGAFGVGDWGIGRGPPGPPGPPLAPVRNNLSPVQKSHGANPPARQSAWSPDRPHVDGGATYGTAILDSGATYSYLASDAYAAVLGALEAAISGGGAAPPPGRRRAEQVAPGRRRRRRRLLQAGGIFDVLGLGGGGGGGGGAGEYDDDDSAAADAARPRAGAAPPGRGAVTVTKLPDGFAADDTCWALSGPGAAGVRNEYDLSGIFPVLALRLAGNSTYSLPPHRYLHVAGRSKAASAAPRVRVCLGIFDGQGETILGA
jgi:hypothetical protein